MSLQPDERTSMEIFAKKTVYCERNTVVTVVKADRAVDTGTYKIRLVCEGGTFEVHVYGKSGSAELWFIIYIAYIT